MKSSDVNKSDLISYNSKQAPTAQKHSTFLRLRYILIAVGVILLLLSVIVYKRIYFNTTEQLGAQAMQLAESLGGSVSSTTKGCHNNGEGLRADRSCFYHITENTSLSRGQICLKATSMGWEMKQPYQGRVIKQPASKCSKLDEDSYLAGVTNFVQRSPGGYHCFFQFKIDHQSADAEDTDTHNFTLGCADSRSYPFLILF
jgi:hypothetical protein